MSDSRPVPSAGYLPEAPPLPPSSPAPYCPPSRTTNGFAIVSLVLGIFAPCGGGLFSLIFGIVALRQIKRRGQRGRSLAIGGLAAIGLWAVVIAVMIALSLASEAQRDDSGQITRAGRVSTQDLWPGDCIASIDRIRDDDFVGSLPAIPCDEPHEAEVYARIDAPSGDWPGDDALLRLGDNGCEYHLEVYSPEAYDDPSVSYTYLYPSTGSWDDGDREIVCLAFFPDGRRAGSIRG